MDKIRLITLSLVICLLAACAPSAQAVQTAIAKTQTAIPITLSKIDLKPILILPGDFPADYVAGQPRSDHLPEMFNDVIGYVNAIYQDININGEYNFVTIFLFDSKDKQDTAYFVLTKTFGEDITLNKTWQGVELQPFDVGEKSLYFADTYSTGINAETVITDFVFSRCQAIAYIELNDKVDITTNYAKKLDKRLSDLICHTK